MADSSSALVIDSYNKTHRQILDFLEKLTNEQLHWRLQPEYHSIAFHAWHVGRWNDYLQACVPGMTAELSRRLPGGVEIWEAEGLAKRWGFHAATLGFAETGMRMPDELALQLPFPPKKALLDYLERVATQAQVVMSAIDDAQFQAAEQPQPKTDGIRGGGTVGNSVLAHLNHNNRHLGMMECLLGLQGQPGTATR